MDFVGLGGKNDRNKRVAEFSKGMRQRVGIAQSLINDPKILFYDEPTSGLDAIARRDIRDLMLELKRRGKTMFLSSHQLEDVEMVCHRVSIIHKGKLQVMGSVDDLLAGERTEITDYGSRRRQGAGREGSGDDRGRRPGHRHRSPPGKSPTPSPIAQTSGRNDRSRSFPSAARSKTSSSRSSASASMPATGSVTATVTAEDGPDSLKRVAANKYKEMMDKE